MKAYLRPSISTALVFFFSLILLFLGLFAEVFESRTTEVDLAQIYANPVPVVELQYLKELKMVNKQGEFLFENTHPQGNLSGPWQMVEPQALRVKNDVITRIVDSLNVIRVRNLYKMEPINISSFSLDNPTLTLLFTTMKGKAYEIKMGLINPIDNSAYLGLSTQNQIYQIDPIEMTLESYDLAQLVESKILALNPEVLRSIEIYNQKNLALKLIKNNSAWVNDSRKEFSRSKVSRFLEKLEELKSFSILDNLTTEQQEFMNQFAANPAYTFKIITASGVRTYVVSEVKGKIPGMPPLDRKSFYAISSEEKKSFSLIDKDQINILNTKNSDLN